MCTSKAKVCNGCCVEAGFILVSVRYAFYSLLCKTQTSVASHERRRDVCVLSERANMAERRAARADSIRET